MRKILVVLALATAGLFLAAAPAQADHCGSCGHGVILHREHGFHLGHGHARHAVRRTGARAGQATVTVAQFSWRVVTYPVRRVHEGRHRLGCH